MRHSPKEDLVHLIHNRIEYPDKPHVLAVPTWNAQVSLKIGIQVLTKTLRSENVNAYSFGFERNTFWQRLDPSRIIVVPYVVKPTLSPAQLKESRRRKSSGDKSVFYYGQARNKAVDWAGCNRTALVQKLIDHSSDQFNVQLASDKQKDGSARISQSEYNQRVLQSDYCLILCGDTPSSRSLSSAMILNCIPLFVGSRLRGLCEPPCHSGWGWTLTNSSHLPFGHHIDWNVFPEVSERDMMEDPVRALSSAIEDTDRESVAAVLHRDTLAWVYGWGSPVNSSAFGQAVDYAWDSVQQTVRSVEDW